MSDVHTPQMKLTVENRIRYNEELEKILCGEIGRLIFLRIDPSSKIVKPLVNQPRTYEDDTGDIVDDSKYKYASCVILKDGTKELDIRGNVILTHSDAQLDLYDKDRAAFVVSMEKINKVKMNASKYINTSLSEESIAILKSKGIEKYSEALNDPVIMLKLIDQTHQLSDDANQVKATTDLINCRQENYDGYLSFIADFNKLLLIADGRFNKDKSPEAHKSLHLIWKSLLIHNVCKAQFGFVIHMRTKWSPH